MKSIPSFPQLSNMFRHQSLIRQSQRKVLHLCKLCSSSCSAWSPSKRLPIIHHEDYICDLPPNHRFPMPKFTKIYECLLKDGVIDKQQVSRPSKVSVRTTEKAHTKEYVSKFFSGRTSEKEQRATGFKWSSGLVKRCRYETGGTVLASEIALSRGLAASTAGGTHHAFPGHGAGFCLINDMAIAACHLIEKKKVEKVLIVDLDVHQGDGSADIFKHDTSVFTLSVHCGKNYPSRKQESDLDISIEPDVEDEEYLSVVKEHLPWVVDSFRPDLVIYDAGVDPHVKDDLGKLNLTDKDESPICAEYDCQCKNPLKNARSKTLFAPARQKDIWCCWSEMLTLRYTQYWTHMCAGRSGL